MLIGGRIRANVVCACMCVMAPRRHSNQCTVTLCATGVSECVYVCHCVCDCVCVCVCVCYATIHGQTGDAS